MVMARSRNVPSHCCHNWFDRWTVPASSHVFDNYVDPSCDKFLRLSEQLYSRSVLRIDTKEFYDFYNNVV